MFSFILVTHFIMILLFGFIELQSNPNINTLKIKYVNNLDQERKYNMTKILDNLLNNYDRLKRPEESRNAGAHFSLESAD